MKDEDFEKLVQLVDDLDRDVCGAECEGCVFKSDDFFNNCVIAEFQDCLSKYKESKDE